MFLPIGDAPNPPGTPVATYALIALNTFIWVAVCAPHLSAYETFLQVWAFTPAHPTWAGLAISMFLHGGWMHLLGNMLALYIFGDNVEAHLGRGLYVTVYLVTGAIGTLCYALFSPHSQGVVIGASGAICGIMGCYLVLYPHNRVRVFVFFVLFVDIVYVPARVVLSVWMVLGNLLPWLRHASGGIAYGAHVGGFAAGAGFAALHGRLVRCRAQPRRRPR